MIRWKLIDFSNQTVDAILRLEDPPVGGNLADWTCNDDTTLLVRMADPKTDRMQRNAVVHRHANQSPLEEFSIYRHALAIATAMIHAKVVSINP
jgi:hypothetical protein